MSVTREPTAPGDYRRIGRRDLLRLWGPAVLAGAAIAGGGATLHGRPGRHQQLPESTTPPPPDWRVAGDAPALAVTP